MHYHFRSIDDLRRQAALSGIEKAVTELVASFTSTDEVERGIANGFQAIGATSGGDEALILMNEAALAAARDPELGQSLSVLWAGVRQSMAEWLATVAPDVAPPGAVAATIVAAIDGAAIQHSIDPCATRLDSIAAQLTRLASPVDELSVLDDGREPRPGQ